MDSNNATENIEKVDANVKIDQIDTKSQKEEVMSFKEEAISV